MDSLRAEVDRIIDQHFEPSTLGRIQAVDEIMAAIDSARPRVTAAALAAPATSGHVVGQQVQTTQASERLTPKPKLHDLMRGASAGRGPTMSDQMWTVPTDPPTFGIRFTPEARQRLLDTNILRFTLTASEWSDLEAVLTELLAPPVRYVLGVDPSHDRCQRCLTNARNIGDYLCLSCRQDGDPHG